ncbi:hypothetical protein ACH5RR_004817 [Cinchona calisaya]|uniref:DUF4378 domain-containing protein n=1 Tax=Cinchona calisaya TaxID=153742 RepID=A0ABD3AYR9_9GENT
METARHRRSKSATILQGNFRIHKHKAVTKPPSDSRSCSGGIIKEDMSMSESGQNSLKRGSGTPIKKLLAEEMAKESETRRRSPGVIARLMGLDGLPSPQHGNKQQKRSFEKHHERVASLGIDQNEQSYEGQSSNMIPVDQQDFKDVYEDMEASHVTNHRYSLRWSANSRFAMPEMAHIQPKITDAKNILSNEKLQVHKEIDDSLDILDSSKDLKYHEQPHPVFLNQLHDKQIDPYSPLEQSSSAEVEGSVKAWKSARDGSYKRDIRSRQKREDGLLLQSHNHRSSYHYCKAEMSQLNVKDETDILPTRIVVLKPNLVKRVNAVTPVSLPEPSCTHLPSLRKHLKLRSSDAEELLSFKKENLSSEICILKPRSREDREIAKEITRQMREHFTPFRGHRGYAGDESSYDVYEGDSSSSSEEITLSSRNLFDGNNRIKSSSGPYKSLVSMEAKKRLSERWKKAQKSQSFETITKVSTLGEMLAVPDREIVQEHFDAAICLDGASEGFSGSSDSSGWDGPIGFSSGNRGKGGCSRSSWRSRSLPPSSVASRSCKTSRCDPLFSDLVKNEKICRGRSKERKGNLSKKDKFSSKDGRSSIRTSHPCHSKGNDSGLSPDVNSSPIQEDISSCKENEHEKHLLDCHITELANSKPESLNLSLDSSLNLHPKHTDMIKKHDNSSACDQEVAKLQESALGQAEGASASLKCAGPEPESSESSKEADHHSPVSVLEVSSMEDVSSSSDCFETVNARLNELRMQLQLLKIESGGYTGPAVLSLSSKDVMQQQPEVVYEEKSFVGRDSWESSYIVDAILYSGLEEFDSDTSVASWHSPECPLGSWVFTNLEKKYNGNTTDLKFERRLLFDRINSALLEIFQQHAHQCPWVQPKMIGTSKWPKHGIKDYLIKLLVNQEQKVNGVQENRLDREMNWLGYGDEMDVIGKEIEKLLIDDLIGEVVAIV